MDVITDVELVCQLIGSVEELVLAYCLTWSLAYEPGQVCVEDDA